MPGWGNKISNQKNWWFFFSEIFTHKTVGLIEKGLLFPGKMLVSHCNLPYLEVNRIYKWPYCGCMHNSHVLNKCSQLKLQQIFSGKIVFRLVSTNFLWDRYVQNTCKGNKSKVKSMKPKLLKTFSVSPLISFIGTYREHL